MEAIGGAGVTDIIRAGDNDQTKAQKRRLITVGSVPIFSCRSIASHRRYSEPVVSITISLTSTLLLAGTSTGIIHIYDIPSHQLLRSISTHKGFSIAHLATMLKPPDLIGHVSLSINAGHSSESIPVRHVAPFQRMRDAKSRDAHDITMILPVQDNVCNHPVSSRHRRLMFCARYRFTKTKEVCTPPKLSFVTTISSFSPRRPLGKMLFRCNPR